LQKERALEVMAGSRSTLRQLSALQVSAVVRGKRRGKRARRKGEGVIWGRLSWMDDERSWDLYKQHRER
jgi:hypothetical protein